MHMIEVLGIFAVLYFVTFAIICLLRDKINVKIGNLAFVLADVVFFSFWTYSYYQMGWLQGDEFLTLGNISPLCFTLIAISPFMGEKVRDHVYSALSCLWVGMFIAFIFSPSHAYLFSFREQANLNYAAEAACHILCSLFGIYLVITKQVKLSAKTLIKAMICLYSIISMAVVLNFVYHRSYFGMDPYGKYSIYMLDLFGSFWTTLIAYFLGIFVVLVLGWQSCRGVMRLLDGRRPAVSEDNAQDIDGEPMVEPNIEDNIDNESNRRRFAMRFLRSRNRGGGYKEIEEATNDENSDNV